MELKKVFVKEIKLKAATKQYIQYDIIQIKTFIKILGFCVHIRVWKYIFLSLREASKKITVVTSGKGTWIGGYWK